MYGAHDYLDTFPQSQSMANRHYTSQLAVLCISTTPHAQLSYSYSYFALFKTPINKCTYEPVCHQLQQQVCCVIKCVPYHQSKSSYAPGYSTKDKHSLVQQICVQTVIALLVRKTRHIHLVLVGLSAGWKMKQGWILKSSNLLQVTSFGFYFVKNISEMLFIMLQVHFH